MSINDFHQKENLTQNSKLLLTPNQKKNYLKKNIYCTNCILEIFTKAFSTIFIFHNSFLIPFYYYHYFKIISYLHIFMKNKKSKIKVRFQLWPFQNFGLSFDLSPNLFPINAKREKLIARRNKKVNYIANLTFITHLNDIKSLTKDWLSILMWIKEETYQANT